MQGPVVQPFSYDEAHPYAAGQHRGVDIGADAAGESVVAPAAGTVSFAGTVAANGKSVTIETADGYSVTLTHLGSIAVAKGATVAEQDVVGTVGPSGTPEVDGPYVHLGIRVTADPDGYVDPLGLLPPAGAGERRHADRHDHVAAGRERQHPRLPRRASRRRAAPEWQAPEDQRTSRCGAVSASSGTSARRSRARTLGRLGRGSVLLCEIAPSEPTTSSSRRPVSRAGGCSADRSRRRSRVSAELRTSRRGDASRPARCPRSCAIWAAALFALGAALGARRQRPRACPPVGAQVLRLPPPEAGPRQVSRAA